MVSAPGEYSWSSYRANAEGEGDDFVSPHPLYLALGPTIESRIRAYRNLFRNSLEPDVESAIRDAITYNHFLGGEDFRVKLEQLAGRPVSASSRGRRAKRKERSNVAETTE